MKNICNQIELCHVGGTLRKLANPITTRLRVLVVEDDEPWRAALKDQLESKGFETTCVGDGIEAIEALHAIDHDVLLLDLGIPGMTGSKLLHELRSDHELEQIPIVILSGSAEEQLERAKRQGAFAAHRKPARIGALTRSLREAVYHA